MTEEQQHLAGKARRRYTNTPNFLAEWKCLGMKNQLARINHQHGGRGAATLFAGKAEAEIGTVTG